MSGPSGRPIVAVTSVFSATFMRTYGLTAPGRSANLALAFSFPEVDAIVSRTGYTGEDGYAIYTVPISTVTYFGGLHSESAADAHGSTRVRYS
ncbi:MAG: hypothetical protein FJW35_04780 [Acidobacteria bacterium]|nr:hypothetical protein [Acidobacteriota bacterium]